MFGEGAEVGKTGPLLLESLDKLYESIRKYPPSLVFNMNEAGLFHKLLTYISLLMPNEDVSNIKGKKNQRLGDFGCVHLFGWLQ